MSKTANTAVSLAVAVLVGAALGTSAVQAETQKMKTNIQQKKEEQKKGVANNMRARTAPQPANTNAAAARSGGGGKKR
ncbi:MAG: hypothetical protein JOZ70_15505 [Pseudolabrys sp.]|nr:hypothetical protein [Pseudolabrys sp.]